MNTFCPPNCANCLRDRAEENASKVVLEEDDMSGATESGDR